MFNSLFISNQGQRVFTWLGEEDVVYSNWQVGEPKQMAGCGHMTSTGQWVMSPCDDKLEAAICEISGKDSMCVFVCVCVCVCVCPLFHCE